MNLNIGCGSSPQRPTPPWVNLDACRFDAWADQFGHGELLADSGQYGHPCGSADGRLRVVPWWVA